MVQDRKTSISDIPLDFEPDAIGTEQYVKGLVKFIKHSTTPITIALQGEWGSGKTSLMNKLHNNLCGDNGPFVGININTWEFSMMSTPEETVLRIIEHLVKRLSVNSRDSNTVSKFSKWAKLGGGIAFRAAREATKIIGGVAGSLLVEGLVGGGPDGTSKEEEITLAELKKALENSVEDMIMAGKRGVIVFVDDLDRLNPSVAVEILELLKNMFTLRHCLFVLAIDYDVVVKGLRPKFGELTEKNEREFRSFFDKIIQVPFSLPVSNYHPEDFLIGKLLEVGYLTEQNLINIDSLRNSLSEITEKTVGKNPRAIKRLINSLSLINCITSVGSDTNEFSEFEHSVAGKIINFAIIALQISYPKIYSMFVAQSNLDKWDIEFASRFNIRYSEKETDEVEPRWEDILAATCTRDPFLQKHEKDIKDVLERITDLVQQNSECEDVQTVLRKFIDKTSVTGIGISTISPSAVDYPQIVKGIHEYVLSDLKSRHADWTITSRRITNSGGFNLKPLTKNIQTTIYPLATQNGKISLGIKLPMDINVIDFPNIKRLIEMGHEKATEDPKLNDLINDFDNIIKPLRGKEWFSGDTLNRYFVSKWQRNGKWLNAKRIMFIPEYKITSPLAEGFQASEIIEAISKLHEGLWNIYLKAKTI